MQVEVWRISGSSGFHFGRHGLGQEETFATMPSDSLFSALINRLAVSGADVESFMQPFKAHDAPFALSSTFPYAGGVLFFPVPFAVIGSISKEEDAKKYKRVQYVSQKLFMDLVEGRRFVEVYQSAYKIMGDTVLLDASEKESLPADIHEGNTPIWKLETRPRVTLGRTAQNSSVFFTGRVEYASECGLWFGIYWRDQSKKGVVKNLFTELGDAGLGAERSVGFGGCTIDTKNIIDLPEAAGNRWVSLSRYLPRQEEIGALSEGAYKIVNIGGWLDSPVKRGLRRRAVNMLEEGATLGAVSAAIPGVVVDVRPSFESDTDPLGHAVYRSGLALAVAWKGELT